MKKRITQALIEATEPAQNGDIYISDDGVSGFRLRVTPTGKRILYFQYRAPDGRQRKLTLTGNVDEARRKAKDAASRVAKGEDPQAEVDRRALTPTLRAAADSYLAEHVRPNLKASTAELYDGAFRGLPDKLMGKKLMDVSPADIGAVMRDMKDRSQRANSIHSVLHAFFEWCAAPDIGLLDAGKNPARGARRYPAVRRSFVFEGDQLFRFREALEKADKVMWPPAVEAVRLLLFTGMRRDEVLHLKWTEVDIEGKRINLKDSKSGARMVPLGKDAIAVLQRAVISREMFKSDYVFPSPKDRAKPIVGFKKMWLRLLGIAGLENIRVHDLRHNYGGMAAASTRSAVHVKTLLGHTQISTTDRYMKLAETPQTEAADATNEAISQAMQPKNVVTIRGRG